MFENLLHQNRVVQQMVQEIQGKSLPPSILISGPSRSGKLTLALELARALSCQLEAKWNCNCPHCQQHRSLDYPWMTLMGQKPFSHDLHAAARLLRLSDEPRGRTVMIRSLKKLLRRFDPLLWEGEDTKYKAFTDNLTKLSDDLELLLGSAPLPAGTKGESFLKKMLERAQSLEDALPAAGITINQIRKVSFWVRNTSPGTLKFIIMENADRMQVSARNSLLKILEEPPEGVYFLLLTSQKGAILPTILSRVRNFHMAERTPEEQQVVLEKIFQEKNPDFPTLEAFFESLVESSGTYFLEQVEQFFQQLLEKRPVESFPSAVTAGFRSFLIRLVGHLQKALRHPEILPGVNVSLMIRWVGLIQEALNRGESFNINSALLLEGLYVQMRSDL